MYGVRHGKESCVENHWLDVRVCTTGRIIVPRVTHSDMQVLETMIPLEYEYITRKHWARTAVLGDKPGSTIDFYGVYGVLVPVIAPR